MPILRTRPLNAAPDRRYLVAEIKRDTLRIMHVSTPLEAMLIAAEWKDSNYGVPGEVRDVKCATGRQPKLVTYVGPDIDIGAGRRLKSATLEALCEKVPWSLS